VYNTFISFITLQVFTKHFNTFLHSCRDHFWVYSHYFNSLHALGIFTYHLPPMLQSLSHLIHSASLFLSLCWSPQVVCQWLVVSVASPVNWHAPSIAKTLHRAFPAQLTCTDHSVPPADSSSLRQLNRSSPSVLFQHPTPHPT
jgi:hypothetical protein